jgi:hypothetical protein
VWAIDFQFDQTADGHNLELLHVVDEFTREALAIECHRRIDADKTVDILGQLVGERGTAPGFLRCDNGPEMMTANAIRGWCRFSRAGSAYIEPGSPWQNAYVESFGGRVRDELGIGVRLGEYVVPPWSSTRTLCSSSTRGSVVLLGDHHRRVTVLAAGGCWSGHLVPPLLVARHERRADPRPRGAR